MSSFKMLCGQDYLTPVKWLYPFISIPTIKEMLEEMDHQLKVINQNHKMASDDKQKLRASIKMNQRI